MSYYSRQSVLDHLYAEYSLLARLDMELSDMDDSREHSPIDCDTPPKKLAPTRLVGEADAQNSQFLKLPVDIFKCVTDYLDRDAAWSLKRLCRGMAHSKLVDEILYRCPITARDVKDLRLSDWKYRSAGRRRWQAFQQCINDSNRHCVQQLALSHWCSIADFKWVEENLPSLTSLDLTSIKDFVWTGMDCEIWTWEALAETCPTLFSRITELEVANWADYAAHSRVEYSYSYNDYRFKPAFRLCRRRNGGSVAKTIFPLCGKLKTLGIRERSSAYSSWNEYECHQNVCVLIDGIQKNCPPTLKKLRIHDFAPWRALFMTDASKWENLEVVEIGLYSWMQDRRERDTFLSHTHPPRILAGHTHRAEEESFNDKTSETCERNHMDLGKHISRGDRANFEDILQNICTFTTKYPNIRIQPMCKGKDVVLFPLHLLDVHQPRRPWPAPPALAALANQALTQGVHLPFLQPQQQQQQQDTETPQPDPMATQEVHDVIQWLVKKCKWKPILVWDPMMCDVFPQNLDPIRPFLPKPDVISKIQGMIQTLRSLDVPIRLSFGDRTHTCSNPGIDGSLFMGDYKCLLGEGDEKHELLAPTQARFNLAGIAPLVDELSIVYQLDMPGVAGWAGLNKPPTEAEKELMRKEMRGWRRFWRRYALLFKNLKKLTVLVPTDIYNDWGRLPYLPELLADERWDVLETDGKLPLALHHWSHFMTLSHIQYAIAKKKPRMRFVQKVFFRRDNAELSLGPQGMPEKMREEYTITDSQIATPPADSKPHRFWRAKTPTKASNSEKRKVDEDQGGVAVPAKRTRLNAAAAPGTAAPGNLQELLFDL